MMSHNKASIIPAVNTGNQQQEGPPENPRIQHLDRILSELSFNLCNDIDTIARQRIEMINIRQKWIDSKIMTKNLKLQLNVATSDIQTIRFELKESKKRTERLEKELDIAATVLYSSETSFRVLDLLKYDRMISFECFQEIGCLFDEQYENPLLGLWLLRHIIQTTTHQIDRDWATFFLSLAILQGNCISYDTDESDTRKNRVKNFSDPRNADKFMRNVVCQGVRDSYEYYRTKFLSELLLDAYSKKALSYVRKHSIPREEQ
jgi:hypothetical protein